MTDTKTTVSEKVARPVRTAVQMTPAAIVVEIVDSTFWDMNERQYMAIFAGLTLLFGFIQVQYENRTGKAFLRKMPPREVGVVEDSSPAPVADLSEDELDDGSDEDLEPADRQWGSAVSADDDHGHNVGEPVDDPYGDAR